MICFLKIINANNLISNIIYRKIIKILKNKLYDLIHFFKNTQKLNL